VIPMTNDDGNRAHVGVIVTLRDIGGGKSRVTLDDVKSESAGRETQWSFDFFYTHKDFDTAAIDSMRLPSEEYEGLGAAIMARLLALTGRATSSDVEPEDRISSDEDARGALLTPQQLARIDASLISQARAEWRKVAMVVALAMADCQEEIKDVSDAFYARRVAKLVSDGELLASGDLRKMRYCEVKLPESHR
jgi:hypothetical protein